jgi:predicted phosphoribosyltransferase
MNPEYAVAAVSENELIISERENPDPEYLKTESAKERQEIQRRLKEYRGQKPEIDLKNKLAILVDDGLATGLTMAVTIKEVRLQNPAKIIVAVPVAPPETVEKLRSQVDEIIVLNIDPDFFAVGQFYDEFPQVGDDEVKELLLD